MVEQRSASSVAVLSVCLAAWLSCGTAEGADFHCAAGDVPCLIEAIHLANGNGEPNTIHLDAGIYSVTAIDNEDNGLPVIVGTVGIRGAGADATIIERPLALGSMEPRFRLLSVAATGELQLEHLTVRGGNPRLTSSGGAILSTGTVTINSSVITQNDAGLAGAIHVHDGGLTLTDSRVVDNRSGLGGGIVVIGFPTTAPGGAVRTTTITRSTISHNHPHTGAIISIENDSTVTIRDSDVSANGVLHGQAILVGRPGQSEGVVTISNTTIAHTTGSDSWAVYAFRDVLISNSTIANNAGGVLGVGPIPRIQNSIVAGNYSPTHGAQLDCGGSGVVSLGHNLFGNPSNCGDLQPTDLTGDAGLGTFVDAGFPGGGHIPLLSQSRAIDAGAPCAGNDQLDTPRLGACDIGAVEFYPVVNDLVALDVLSTAFDPTPVPGGPAGTLRISAEYRNNSGTTIAASFLEVSELSGHNLLLNASRSLFGPGQAQGTATGGVGARVSLGNYGAGAGAWFDLAVGLATTEPFTFFVNVHGAVQPDGF